MPSADEKKAATIRNLWYTEVAAPIISADALVAAIRAAITSNDLAGQFTSPELTAMLDVETALNTLAALPGVTQAASHVAATHTVEPETVGLEV